MRTIVLGNWKGGVGKTTVSTNLAYAFTKEFPDLHVLFIDADKQGNASSRFCADMEKPNLTDVLVEGIDIRKAIQHSQYPNIDIIASDPSLLEANLSVLKEQERRQDNILELALEPIKDEYEICIIDTPPDFNISVLNCLNICDDLIGITTLNRDSIDGIRQLQKNVIHGYNEALGRNLAIRGILVNMYKQNAESLRCVKELQSEGFKVFDSYLRSARTTADHLQIATNEQKSIFEIAPKCTFATGINKFMYELIKGGE